MRICCGTDFSASARDAAEVAALLAVRDNGSLHLVHALDTRGAVFGAAHVLHSLEASARQRLEREAEHLGGLGARLTTAMPDGWPDEAVLAEAGRDVSELLVIGATGLRDPEDVHTGKTCERVLTHARMPMLVVRDAGLLRDWLRGERALRIVLAFDFSSESAAALAFVVRLARIGNCRIVAVFADDPAHEAARLGITDPERLDGHLRETLADRIARLAPDLPVDVIVADHHGNTSDRLVELAEREEADLLVCGSRPRGAVKRRLLGSVSRQLLRDSGCNLLVVQGASSGSRDAAGDAASGSERPATAGPAATMPARPPRRILVATDLSPIGNLGVDHALAIAAEGARVRIVQVISPNLMLDQVIGRPGDEGFAREHKHARAQALERLRRLVVPERGEARGIGVEFEVIDHDLPATAIAQEAERFDADLVCLGTLGRSGLSAALLGSTAQDVLKRCRRPMLLVPARPG